MGAIPVQRLSPLITQKVLNVIQCGKVYRKEHANFIHNGTKSFANGALKRTKWCPCKKIGNANFQSATFFDFLFSLDCFTFSYQLAFFRSSFLVIL